MGYNLQEGRKVNIGWSIHFDAQYNNISILYHTEEDKNRFCGTRCCQKKDVLFTHTDVKVADKFFEALQKRHQDYKNSDDVKLKREEIRTLQKKLEDESRQFAKDSLGEIKDTMLEYLI